MRHPRHVTGWAEWFAVLGDPSRLMLLSLIARDGPISVSALAAASGLRATTVSHSLRLLRVHDMVHTERDGHTVRYWITEAHPATNLLDQVVDTDPADPYSRGVPR